MGAPKMERSQHELETLLSANVQDQNSRIFSLCGEWILIDKEDVEKIESLKWSVYRAKGLPVFQSRVPTKDGAIRMNLPRFLFRPREDQVTSRLEGTNQWDYRKSAFGIRSPGEKTALQGKRSIQTTSKYKGVSFSRKSGLWRASIRPQGASILIGEFESEAEAALAYNEAARKYFGDYAFQNDIDGDQSESLKNKFQPK